eukprot:356178-Chlamydomonas_euryale.AAC.4
MLTIPGQRRVDTGPPAHLTQLRQRLSPPKKTAPVTGMHYNLCACARYVRAHNWGRFFDDGLHYTPEGNEAVYQAVRSVLHDSFPHLNPDAMPMHFPAWDDVDAEDPSATFGPGVAV